jgi:2-dehydropantoate 2-reductase
MLKILIAGIGGVGGYYGGLLAKQFHQSKEVEIYFLARGKHLEEIKTNGLRVSKGNGEFICKPKLATDDPDEIGVVDLVIVCTKSYDLEYTIMQLQNCINSKTLILPLLNGVDSCERISKLLPYNNVLGGCVYIVSRLTAPGKVENVGNIETLFFGSDSKDNGDLKILEKLFLQANIQATLSKEISTIIWEKFIFISPTATATAFFDCTIQEIMGNNIKEGMIIKLIEEVKQIASAKKIPVSEEITQRTLSKLMGMPAGATSSMHHDFKNKKQFTELESLTGYVVKQAQHYNIATPIYEEMLKSLQ